MKLSLPQMVGLAFHFLPDCFCSMSMQCTFQIMQGIRFFIQVGGLQIGGPQFYCLTHTVQGRKQKANLSQNYKLGILHTHTHTHTHTHLDCQVLLKYQKIWLCYAHFPPASNLVDLCLFLDTLFPVCYSPCHSGIGFIHSVKRDRYKETFILPVYMVPICIWVCNPWYKARLDYVVAQVSFKLLLWIFCFVQMEFLILL